ncbi:hypothetical protein MKW92_030407 [Papaver armeniacum]|nr:hypothetical protein MKW92_030407 [Papaver armeniacum]
MDCTHKEKQLEAQDEALIKSIFHVTPKEVVRRIHDEDDDLYQLPTKSCGTSSGDLKIFVFYEDLGSPTDSLTKHSFGKFMLDSSTVYQYQ